MSRTIILTEDQYAVLANEGAARGQTPEDILADWIEAVRLRNRVEDDPNATQPSTDHRVVASTRD